MGVLIYKRIFLTAIIVFFGLSCAKDNHIKTRYDKEEPLKSEKTWFFNEEINSVLISGAGSAYMNEDITEVYKYSPLEEAILDAFSDIARQLNEKINHNLVAHKVDGSSGVADFYSVETTNGDAISAKLVSVNYNKKLKLISVNMIYNGKNIKRMIK